MLHVQSLFASECHFMLRSWSLEAYVRVMEPLSNSLSTFTFNYFPILAQLLNSNSYTQVKDVADLRLRIRSERYWELPFEDHLYFDEFRWGTWKRKKFKEGNGMTEIWGTATYNYRWVGDQNWTWPIPASEMEMNSNLKQNQGWIN